MSKALKYNEIKILVVDDDPFIRKMFTSMLKNKGFQVFTAANGLEALNIAQEINPNLIFLDIMMPVMDGFQALTELRNSPSTKLTPIIMVTAKADSNTLIQAIKLGANDFIAKPFSRSMVMRKIRFALSDPEIHKRKIGNSDTDTKPTFIHSSVFNQMRKGYIKKFGNIFDKMTRFLAQRNRIELKNLLSETENACEIYEIFEPIPILKDLQKLVHQQKWRNVLSELEKVHKIFKELQLKLKKSETDNASSDSKKESDNNNTI